MLFPYRDKDLIDDISFRQMCKKKGYSILKRDLEYYVAKGMIEVIHKKNHFTYYSKHQFYVLKYIRDNRYKTKGFIRTYHNFNGTSPEKVFKFFDDSVKKFDKNFQRNYTHKFINFFELYYRIEEYIIPFLKIQKIEIRKLSDHINQINRKLADRTLIQQLHKSYNKKNPFKLSGKEKEIINWFIVTHVREHREIFEVYMGSSLPYKSLHKIPAVELVKDFMEIFYMVEILEDIIGENLKDIGVDRYSPAGTFTYCRICSREFVKKKKNQISCSVLCTQKNKNIRKKIMREFDKNYGK